MTDDVAGAAGPPRRLLDDRDFRRYWLARIISLSGSLITVVVMPVLVYRLTGSAALTALTATLDALPYLLIGLFAGALSDRWNRQRVMVAADVANVVVIGSVPVAHFLDILTVPHVLVVGFIAQCLFTFFDGANFGALPVLVGRERVGDANAAIWGIGGILDLVVPAGVGVALAVVHPSTLLVVDALTFLVSALLVRSIRRALSSARLNLEPLRPAVVLRDVREGVRFLWGHDGVRSNTVIGALQSTAGGGFVALFVPWADRVLGVGTSGWRFGLLFAVWGVGGVLASALVPPLLRRYPVARVTLSALPVSAVAGIATAVVGDWVLACVGMVIWGIAYQLVLITSMTYRMQVTPEHLLGRVNTAGRMLSWGLGWTIGSIAGGALAAATGVQPAMVTLVSVGVVAAVFAWVSPLRQIAAGSRLVDGTPT
ncbi:MAG: MFS transporter [Pedococcus sp.]